MEEGRRAEQPVEAGAVERVAGGEPVHRAGREAPPRDAARLVLGRGGDALGYRPTES